MPLPASGWWRKSKPSTADRVSYNVADKKKGMWSPAKTNTMTQSEMGAVWDRYMKEPVDSQQHSKNKMTQGNIKKFESSKRSNSKEKKSGIAGSSRLSSEAVGYSLNAETVAAGCIGAFCILLFMYYYYNHKNREVLYGIELKIQGVKRVSGRSVDQGLHSASSQDTRTKHPRKMTREEIMLDASKRIQRAKNAQIKFDRQSVALSLDKELQSIETNSRMDPVYQPVYPIRDAAGFAVLKEEAIKLNEDDNKHSYSSSSNGKDIAVFAFALASVFMDGISTEIRNMSRHDLSSSRSLECTSQTQFAGKTLLIRSRKSAEKRQEVQKGIRWKFEEMALAPVAPIMKTALSSKHIEVFDQKYNPVFEFQEHLDDIQPPNLESDPILSTIRGLANFQGLRMPSALQKYDPVSALEQVKEPENVSNPVKKLIGSAPPKQSSEPDPIRQLISSLTAFKCPSTFEWIKKYDLLQRLDEIQEIKEPSDYSFLTALIKAKPESDHAGHPWKSLVEIEEPHLKHGERPLQILLNLVQGHHGRIGEIFDKYDMIHDMLGDVTVPTKSKHVDKVGVSSAAQPKTHRTTHDVHLQSKLNESILKK